LFLIIVLFFTEALLISGNLVFGIGRDWDISASVGLTLTLIAIRIFQQITEESLASILVMPIAVASLCGALAWNGLNLSDTASSARFGDLIEIYQPLLAKQLTMLGYENLRKFYMRGDPSSEIRIERKMFELLPRAT